MKQSRSHGMSMLIVLGSSMVLWGSCLPWKPKKNNTVPASVTSSDSTGQDSSKLQSYSGLIKDAKIDSGLFQVIHKAGAYYFEIPMEQMDKDFLLIQKVSSVPFAINEAGLNKGMNFENKVIRFHVNSSRKEVWVSEINPQVEVVGDAVLQRSVLDNYTPSYIETFKIEAYGKDSSSVVVKVNKAFDGTEKSFMDVFNSLGLGTSAKTALSMIEGIKSFDNNVVIRSMLSTRVTEGQSSIPISVAVTNNIYALPEKTMQPRFADPRIGYFTTDRWYFSDRQQELEKRKLITRWRMEPKDADRERYLAGELVEPKKPIVFYIDPATPIQWRQAIIDGVYDWQVAFEAAGFKNAIMAKEVPEGEDIDLDDANISSVVYAASSKSNAMGPSVVDPRSGEILESDVIWWHNVMDMLNAWMRIQTGIVDTAVQGNTFSEAKMAHAIRFVSSHEIGHTLGLMHNMGSSSAFPVDSLRSATFTRTMGGTATSIMDYARFNYVAQPGDGVEVTTPAIGLYDKYAIAWAYRWYGTDGPWQEQPILRAEIEKHQGDPYYWYGEQQDGKNVIDPRAQSEDLGDDAMKAGRYGMANLKRIMPQIINWTTQKGDDYYKAGKLYMGVIGQWYTYADHVINNIGGIYLENPVLGDQKEAYAPVPRAKQEAALQYVKEQVLTFPEWLFDQSLMTKTFPLKDSPVGPFEYAPYNLRREFQYSLLYGLVKDERLLRMAEMEMLFGKNEAWSAEEFLEALRKEIFAKTLQGESLDLDIRMLQQNYVDVLLVSSNKVMEKLATKRLDALDAMLHAVQPQFCLRHSGTHALRNIQVSGMSRTSAMLTQKRAELLAIYALLERASKAGDAITKAHYQDLCLRIANALDIKK